MKTASTSTAAAASQVQDGEMATRSRPPGVRAPGAIGADLLFDPAPDPLRRHDRVERRRRPGDLPEIVDQLAAGFARLEVPGHLRMLVAAERAVDVFAERQAIRVHVVPTGRAASCVP